MADETRRYDCEDLRRRRKRACKRILLRFRNHDRREEKLASFPEEADEQIEEQEEEEEEDVEEVDTYECPECGADITIDMTACPNCGVGLSFEFEDGDADEESEE